MLTSWNEGAARTAIVEFLERVSAEGVPLSARVAVIDNDGTLWCEKPAYIQALYVLARLKTEVAARPELGEPPVVKALLAGDLAAAMQQGMAAVAGVLLELDAGITAEEFTDGAKAWLAEATHPRFGVPMKELTYAPMLELIDLLRTHDFSVFIVTGGGVEFVRAVADEIYGISPDDVVGSSVQLKFERRDGKVVLRPRGRAAGLAQRGRAEGDQHPGPHRPAADPRDRQQRGRHRDARVRAHGHAALAVHGDRPRRRGT